MSIYRVPVVYEHQRIKPVDVNRLSSAVTNLINHFARSLLVDADDGQFTTGVVLWGLRVQDNSDLLAGVHKIKVGTGAALIPSSAGEPWSLLLVDEELQGPPIVLPGAGQLRSDRVALKLTETAEESEQRRYLVVDVGGENTQQQATNTYSRPRGALEITTGPLGAVVAGSVVLATYDVDPAGILFPITDNRVLAWPSIPGWSGEALPDNYMRGVGGGYERIREMVASILTPGAVIDLQGHAGRILAELGLNQTAKLNENLAVHDGGPSLHLFDAGVAGFELDLGARTLRCSDVRSTGVVEADGDVYAKGGDVYLKTDVNARVGLNLVDAGLADERLTITDLNGLGPALATKFMRLGSDDAVPRAQICQPTAPKLWGRISLTRAGGGATEPTVTVKSHRFDEVPAVIRVEPDAAAGNALVIKVGDAGGAAGMLDSYYSVVTTVELDAAGPIAPATIGNPDGAFMAVVYGKTTNDFRMVIRQAGNPAVLVEGDLVNVDAGITNLIVNFAVFGDATGADPIQM